MATDVIKLLAQVFKDDTNRLIHDAIYRLYTNARTIDVDTKNNWVVKDDDGKEVSINWTNVETKVKEIEAENEAAEKVRDEKKASAITKLKTLGLDDDEINAIYNIEDTEPPVVGNGNINSSYVWNAAKDDHTIQSDIEYLVVGHSKNVISTPETALRNGIVLKNWTKSLTSLGGTPSTIVMTVLAKDKAGNISSYNVR